MRYLLTTPFLAPVLVAQGWFVRLRTPRLPEPPGARKGALGAGPTLRVLIVGDSAAAGVGAPNQDVALAGQMAQALSRHYGVVWELFATTGATTRTTLDSLRQRPPQRFDVAVTSLGVNDVTGLVPEVRWRQQQAELRALLRERFGVTQLVVCGVPLMSHFPALPQPLRWYLGSRAAQFTQALERDVTTQANCAFLHMDFVDDAGLMAPDGFHPGPGIYSAWGQRAASAIHSLKQGVGVAR